MPSGCLGYFTAPSITETRMTADADESRPHYVSYYIDGEVNLMWHEDHKTAKIFYEDLGLEPDAKCIVTTPEGTVEEQYGASPELDMCVKDAQLAVGSFAEDEEEEGTVDTSSDERPVPRAAAPAAKAADAPPIIQSGEPSHATADVVFYIYNNLNRDHRLGMWGVTEREMGVYTKDIVNPDEKWIIKPSADVEGYFIIENALRTGYCISVWGDDLEDIGVRPVSEAADSSGELWRISE